MRNTRIDRECRFFKALAHCTRLAIIKELIGREKCVNDIKDLLNARQANISQHLAVLRRADIVGCRFAGTLRCYYLKDPEGMADLLEFVKRLSA
jgi:ArsR family transcriptional regulator